MPPAHGGRARKAGSLTATDARAKIEKVFTGWENGPQGHEYRKVGEEIQRLTLQRKAFTVALKADQDQYDQIGDQINVFKAHRHEMQNRLMHRVRESVIYVRPKASIVLNAQGGPAVADLATWNEGLEVVNRMLGRTELNGRVVTMKPYPASLGRSRWNLGDGHIDLNPGVPAHIVAHEMGHWIEAETAGVHNAALAFLDKRRGNEVLQNLKTVSSSYEPNEQAWFDKFLDPYIGKDYTHSIHGRFSTEIVSVGMEYMYVNPVRFSRKDRDMFDFVWWVLRGA